MITDKIEKLLDKLTPYTLTQLDVAANFAISKGHYEIGLEHLFIKLLNDGKGDIPILLHRFNINYKNFKSALLENIETYLAGNTGKPSLSPVLIDILESAWILASVDFNQNHIRSAHLIMASLTTTKSHAFLWLKDLKDKISKEKISNILISGLEDSIEENINDESFESNTSEDMDILKQFTVNLTAEAKKGNIDPVFARNNEIKQIIDILSRRKKNNPLLVGNPGVGKSAIAEGLALKIIEGDVPRLFKNADLLALDLGLLQAGASVKGEFENRLKKVIQAIKDYQKPVITFIDEVHTLIGAGNNAGAGDAANLLKPELARGSLHTIAATTWIEFKKYFEKDAALTRRFQPIKISDPDEENAIIILRGLKDKYSAHHNVHITDKAVVATVKMSMRYITDRQLPDKAIDLMDTAAARVALSQHATPDSIIKITQDIATLEREKNAIVIDRVTSDDKKSIDDRILKINSLLADLAKEKDKLIEKWENEKKLVQQYHKTLKKINNAYESNYGTDIITSLKHNLHETSKKLRKCQCNKPMIYPELDENIIADVISDWTGIPLSKMNNNESDKILKLKENLSKRILGQKHAIQIITNLITIGKTKLKDPKKPITCLLIGQSGIGKTETAKALADYLFGSERYMTVINMSEYQEKHTISKLTGSPPGYVGYGEGGILTEAVRQKPYSVVLLDEFEKAHPDVLKLFYQIFDEGTLSDGEGRIINFSNSIIILTTNQAHEELTQIISKFNDKNFSESDIIVEKIKPALISIFPTELLARMTLIPYYPLSKNIISKIIQMKLDCVSQRLKEQEVYIEYEQNVIKWIASHCQATKNGARNIDHVINSKLLPGISVKMLSLMKNNLPIKKKYLDIKVKKDNIIFEFLDKSLISKN